MDTVTLTGHDARAASPEGQAATVSVATLVAKLAPPRMDTCDTVLPDGVKAVLTRGPVTVWVHEAPPRVCCLKWIAADSAVKFGRGTRYRTVRIALPYLVTLAVFAPGEHGRLQLSHVNECFFRAAPLEGVGDALCYPALLNTSRFRPPEGKPLAWICTQYLDRNQFINEPDLNKRMRLSLKLLLQCLLETGFNYSSEHHEFSSWFTESTSIDPRLATVERWEEATAMEPLFALDVPWLPTGLSLKQVVERICGNLKAAAPAVATSADVARLIFNHK